MNAKTIKSPGENGEYLISEDILDKKITVDGKTVWVEVPCWSVSFRKDSEEDYESLSSYLTLAEAEAYVRNEIERNR